MANIQDASINVKPETTPGVAVTPDRAYEFTDESLAWTPTIVQGEGLRVGSYMNRAARRVVPSGQGAGGITMEVASKGFGYWWQACMGTATSNLVSGSTYQQVHTWAKQPSTLTVQKSSIRADGTVDPMTFKGVSVASWTLTFNNQGLVTLAVTLDAMDYDTSTGFATLTYASSPNLFHFGNWTLQTGSVTTATTTALATAGSPTSLVGVRSMSITGNRNLVVDRFNAVGTGRKQQQIATRFDVTGSMDIEYGSTTQRDAYLAQTAQGVVSTVSAGALSTGNETLQVVMPALYIDDGGVPQTGSATDLLVQSVSFTVLDNLTATPFQLVTRTADSAV